jgi:hypothetical protein
MKNTKKVLRKVIYDALNGVISVPVFDEKKLSTSLANAYVLLSTQQEVNDNSQDSFMTLSSIDIEIYKKTGSEVSKDSVDDIEDEILAILHPLPATDGISTYSGFQVVNFRRDRSITRVVELSATESIVRTITTITATIVQQF